jgi:hypothetical protein
VWRAPYFWFCAANRAYRINQIDWAVMMAARAAIVTRLVRRAAFGTRPPDEPIGKKRLSLGIIKLLDVSFMDHTGPADRLPNLAAQPAILRTMCAAVVVEVNLELGEIPLMLLLHFRNERFFAAVLALGTDHDGRAVRIVGAYIDAAIANQALESDPNVGLHILHQMADMNRPIGIRQGGSDQDSAGHINCGMGKSENGIWDMGMNWELGNGKSYHFSHY